MSVSAPLGFGVSRLPSDSPLFVSCRRQALDETHMTVLPRRFERSQTFFRAQFSIRGRSQQQSPRSLSKAMAGASATSPSTDRKARVLCNFIAGMTDRYGVEFYGRSRSENPQTIFKPL